MSLSVIICLINTGIRTRTQAHLYVLRIFLLGFNALQGAQICHRVFRVGPELYLGVNLSLTCLTLPDTKLVHHKFSGLGKV